MMTIDQKHFELQESYFTALWKASIYVIEA